MVIIEIDADRRFSSRHTFHLTRSLNPALFMQLDQKGWVRPRTL